MTFFNTIEETGQSLVQSTKKAKNQQDIIYSYFVQTNRPLSPSMVLNELNLNCPITSIRRAITNLTDAGKIIKTDQYVKGNYGKLEHLWELATEPIEKQQCLFNAAWYSYVLTTAEFTPLWNQRTKRTNARTQKNGLLRCYWFLCVYSCQSGY